MIPSLERRKGLFLILSLLLNVHFVLYTTSFKSTGDLKSNSSCTKIVLGANAKGNATSTSNSIQNPTNSNKNNHTVYAHIHMAKTAGTDLNVQLAHQFERVCGHKGYSYDSYQVNERVASAMANSKGRPILLKQMRDSTNKLGSSRGQVTPDIMAEIGYEDCDWISLEQQYTIWGEHLPWSLYQQYNVHVEYHVPCRQEPLQHLMSQCNHRGNGFDCEAEDLEGQIRNCLVSDWRFSLDLIQQHPNNNNKKSSLTTSMKCFDAMSVDGYVNYMSTKLQTKRMVNHTSLKHRESNTPRDKKKECIWGKDAAFQENVRQRMYKIHDYYQYCRECFETKENLLF